MGKMAIIVMYGRASVVVRTNARLKVFISRIISRASS